MIGFREFMESSLRNQLKIPQNPVHHREGDTGRHSLMVRTALPAAIAILREKQAQDPTGPLSKLNLNFSQEDTNLLRLAAWMHDIGKGNALDPETLSAHGHENPSMFKPAMRQLGPVWRQIFDKALLRDKLDLFFIIKSHMSLDDDFGIRGRKNYIKLIDKDGKYKDERRIKLLLCILLMDRMGRGGEPGVTRDIAKSFAKSNTQPAHAGMTGIYATADTAAKQWQREKTNVPAPNSPEEFVSLLRSMKKPDDVIKKALKGKRPDLSPAEIDSYFTV